MISAACRSWRPGLHHAVDALHRWGVVSIEHYTAGGCSYGVGSGGQPAANYQACAGFCEADAQSTHWTFNATVSQCWNGPSDFPQKVPTDSPYEGHCGVSRYARFAVMPGSTYALHGLQPSRGVLSVFFAADESDAALCQTACIQDSACQFWIANKTAASCAPFAGNAPTEVVKAGRNVTSGSIVALASRA